MRPVSPFHLPYPDVRALRIALAAGAVAGLVVIAACTDKGDKSITAPSSLRSDNSGTGGFTLKATATVCIDGGAPVGEYFFTNSAFKLQEGGDGGLSGHTDVNAVDGAQYPPGAIGMHPGDCQQVLTRTAPVNNFCDGAVGPGCGLPLGPPFDGSHQTNVDAYTGVVVTVTGMPPGVTYNHTNCLLDNGVRLPRDANRGFTAPYPGAPLPGDPGRYGNVNWGPGTIIGGNDASNPCNTNNNPSTIFANIAHGMKLTFFFNNPPVLGDCVLGYPYTSANPRTSVDFNESEVLTGFALITGQLHAWYTDEHALTLGVDSIYINNKNPTPDQYFGVSNYPADYAIEKMTNNPTSATTASAAGLPIKVGRVGTTSPPVGLGNAIDSYGRALFPTLYVTDITGLSDPVPHTSAAIRAGDWQYSSGIGNPNKPNAVYGTWKAAVITIDNTHNPPVTKLVNRADPAKNHKVVGPGGVNPLPAAIDNGYSTDIVWNLANIFDKNGNPLVAGHSYRAQVIVHDGDQNKDGGDTGQACVNINF